MKEKPLDAKMVDIEFADELFNGVGTVQIGKGGIVMLDKVDERRGCSGFKPVVSKVFVFEKPKNIKRIVDGFSQEIVSIVPFSNGFFVDIVEIIREYLFKLVLCIPTNRGKIRNQRDIIRIVEPRKDGHFGKLGHPGKHDKPQVGLLGFEDGVDVAQTISKLVTDIFVAQVVEDGFVVLIDKDDNLFSCFLVDVCQQSRELSRQSGMSQGDVIGVGMILEHLQNLMLQFFFRVDGSFSKVDSNDRIGVVPVPFVMNPQSLEQLLASQKKLSDGVDEHGLSKASWSGEKVDIALGDEVVNEGGFVHIAKTTFSNSTEGKDPNGKWFAGHTSSKATSNHNI